MEPTKSMLDSFFPLKNEQSKWEVEKEKDKLHLSNGKHVFSFTSPTSSDKRSIVQKLEAKPIDSFKATHTAQVHRSNPGEIYMTIHEGRANPTFTLKHKYEEDWEVIPKGKEDKRTLLDIFLEKDAGSKGCLMADLNPHDARDVLSWSKWHIDKDKLSDDGFEKKPHTTIMYGFNKKFKPHKLETIEKWPEEPIEVELGKIKRFPANPARPDSDVLVVEVKSDHIVDMNKQLKEEHGKKINNYYKEFNPHLTLAYVKPGALQHLDGNKFFEGKKYSVTKLTYSSPTYEKKEWRLKTKVASVEKASVETLKVHVINDPYLSTEQKRLILNKLKDDTTFDTIMQGASGAVLAHSVSSFLDLDKKTQTLLSLAGFGIGVALNTLFEKEPTNGPIVHTERNIIQKLREGR